MEDTVAMDSDLFTLADFCKSAGPDILAKTRPFMGFIEDMRAKGTYTYRRELRSGCGTWARVRDGRTGRERDMLMLASNNYLGLNMRPEVIEAARNAVSRYGTGLCGAPLLNGTFDLLAELECELADFCGKEAAMVFSTGYSANVGAISALLGPRDAAVIDRLSHASIVDGCRLSGCMIRTFAHEDMKDLEKVLRITNDRGGGRLVIVDGVYSMDGTVANLPEIARLARQYDARVMVDEAHALGVLGPRGAGTVDHFGLRAEVDIIMGTFSKSLGSTGGFIAASGETVNYIRHYGRSYFFSASPTPSSVATALAALKIVRAEPELGKKLRQNVRYLHMGLTDMNMDVRPSPPQSAVLVVIVSPSSSLRAVSRAIHAEGVYVNSVEYPAVPMDEPRLRLGVTASHTRADLDFALDAFEKCLKPLLIPLDSDEDTAGLQVMAAAN